MNPLFDKPFTFDRVARILFGLAVISGIIYLIAVLRNALLPFLIAWLLAYMMQPFVKFFQYKVKLKSRLLSILAVLVSTLLVISLVGVVIVPSVTQEFNRTLELMQEHNSGYGHIPMIPQSWAEYLEKNIDPDQREHRKGGQTDRSQNVDRTDQYFLHSVQYYDRVCNLPLLHLYPVGL